MYFSNWRPLALISNISLHPVQPLKMTPLRTSICNHTFPQKYITLLYCTLIKPVCNFGELLGASLICTYTALKRKGYVLPNNTVSLPLVSRLKLLPPWLFWPDSLSKDLNEYDIFYFPEGFGKNSKLLLRYFNSYNFIPQAYRPGNSLFECPFKTGLFFQRFSTALRAANRRKIEFSEKFLEFSKKFLEFSKKFLSLAKKNPWV